MSDYRQYQIEAKAEKSIPVAVLLGIFLSPFAYVYMDNWGLAAINFITLNYALLGFLIVPLHCAMSIRKARKHRKNMAT